MASYCQIQIVFYSYKAKPIKDLWQKINNYMRFSPTRTVYGFLLEEGYTPKKVASLTGKNNYFMRCNKYVILNKNLAYLKIETASAWKVETRVFYKYICDKYDGQVDMVYLAQEQDNNIFINTDATGFYFWLIGQARSMPPIFQRRCWRLLPKNILMHIFAISSSICVS